jgi:hypothetical protein
MTSTENRKATAATATTTTSSKRAPSGGATAVRAAVAEGDGTKGKTKASAAAGAILVFKPIADADEPTPKTLSLPALPRDEQQAAEQCRAAIRDQWRSLERDDDDGDDDDDDGKKADEWTFRVAAALLYASGRRLGYDEGKLNNGGILEALTAMHLGQRYSLRSNGPDAYDADGRGIEMKNSVVYVSRAHPCADFCYKIKPRPDGASVDEWIDGVRSDWRRRAPGGHQWTAFENGRPAQVFRLSAAFMAEYAAQRLLRNAKSRAFNTGCERCASCGDYHRARWLEQQAAAWDRRADDVQWSSLLGRRVASDCGGATGGSKKQ